MQRQPLGRGDRLLAVERQRVDQLCHQRRIVLRQDAQRVAGLEDEARALEPDLDVADLLAGAPAGDGEVLQNRRRERPSFVIGRRRLDGPPGQHEPRDVGVRTLVLRGHHLLAQALEDGTAPRLGRLLVVDVALDPVLQAGAAQLLEPAVDLARGLAEMLVGRIAEPEHGKAQRGKLGRLAAEQELVEGCCRLGRVALAMRARDDDEKALVLEALQRIVGGVGHPRRHTARLEPRCQRLGHAGRIAGLRGVEHRHRTIGLGGWRRRRGPRTSAQARQIAAGPDGLLGREPRCQPLELGGLVPRQKPRRAGCCRCGPRSRLGLDHRSDLPFRGWLVSHPGR